MIGTIVSDNAVVLPADPYALASSSTPAVHVSPELCPIACSNARPSQDLLKVAEGLRSHTSVVVGRSTGVSGSTAAGLLDASARFRGYGESRAAARAVLGEQGAEASAAIGFGLAPNQEVTSAELRAAIAQVDVTPLCNEGLLPYAAIDFDNTLAAGDTFVAFCSHFAAGGHVLPKTQPILVKLLAEGAADRVDVNALGTMSGNHLLAMAVDLHLRGDLPAKQMLKVGLMALCGHTQKTLDQYACEMFTQGSAAAPPYRDRFFAPDPATGNCAAGLVDALQRAGITPRVFTVGIRFLAQAGALLLGINGKDVYGGELARDANGRVTGELAFDAAAVGKAAMLRERVGTPPLFALGDSAGSDAPMMGEALVQGILCNPSASFVEKVQTEGLPYLTMRWRV
jgi:phosphoserine phosphatase